jgi:membrane protein DedA with SNARE-associated domain
METAMQPLPLAGLIAVSSTLHGASWSSLLHSIETMVSQGGYLGVFLAMLVENVLQFVPSEDIMPLAGYMVYDGKLQLIPTILAGTSGSVLGAIPWLWVGRLVNEDRLEHYLSRHGAWFGVTPGKLRKSRAWFNRYGAMVVFWGRLVPILRTLISIPAGIEMMPWRPFLIWTSLGRLIWNAALTVAGYKLGEHWQEVHQMMQPFTALAAFALVALAALLLWGQRRSAP